MSCGHGQNSGETGICPCGQFVNPAVIGNPPGRSAIQYRVGDFVSFRHALLLSRPGEIELVNWHPGAQGDLAVQMVEWWAYLADILTFYNERIANQDYLRTATLPESVQGLIRILGYRPRPGIGATATLAATLTGNKSITLPAAYAIQSKPGPGQQPQIFETGAATPVQQPDAIPAAPMPSPSLLGQDGQSVLVQGVVTTVKPQDELLLMAKTWPASGSYAVAIVASTTAEKDPTGNTNTRITFTAAPALASANAADYRVLRSKQSARVWQYNAQTGDVIRATQVDLESIVRTVKPKDPLLFTLPDASPAKQLVSLTQYSEAVWFANPVPPYDPTKAPPASSPNEIAIPIPHSSLTFSPALTGVTDSVTERQTSLVEFAWQDVGTVIATPSTTLTSTQVSLSTPLPSTLVPLSNQEVLISDANGNGVEAEASTTDGSTLGLSNFSDPNATLVAPLTVLFNLLAVSRGKTVTNEILGSGDATIASGQEFTLQNSPLTYLMNPNGTSGTGYQSTLQVWVDGVQWQEVQSFYDQPSSAHVFVTSEDDQNVTHVQFGDGVDGARLPSGVNNVVASYRYGGGALSPAAGALSVILQPWPGLKTILNPVAAGGGADPDPPQQIQRYAPQSVTTFGRAISATDYTTIAAQAPGVARARSYFAWNAAQQRQMITIYVGDNQNAVTNANTALTDASDPNRPLQVLLATAIPISLSLTLLVNPLYQPGAVTAGVTAALTDPGVGLLGANVVQIGASVWRSQIEKACLSIPGAVALHDLELNRKSLVFRPIISRFNPLFRFRVPIQPPLDSQFPSMRFDPGEGGFFQLAVADLTITSEVAGNAG
jgi:hypothetical protein